MNRLQVIPATEADILQIAQNLRQADIDEIQASRGNDVELVQHLTWCFNKSSHCWVAIDDEAIPVTVFGVAPVPGVSVSGSPWLLGTDELDLYPSFLAKDSKPYVDLMHEYYPYLLNRVDVRNTKAIRWLQKLGFKMQYQMKHGPYAMPFWFFDKEVGHV